MSRSQRGFSIAEVLTVAVIVGTLLAVMVFVMPVLLRSPVRVQAQVDQVNAAALALYKIRRDFSEGNVTGVMGCSVTPIPSCTVPGPGMQSVQAVAIVTAEDGSGAFQVNRNTGYPDWRGFYIYWLVPNQANTSYDLKRAYIGFPQIPLPGNPGAITVNANGVPTNITTVWVTSLVTTALGLPQPAVLTNNIVSMSIGENVPSSTVKFELDAGAFAGPNLTQTTFQSNTYARN